MLSIRQRLKELDRSSFEELCSQVLNARYPGLGIKKVEGASGDEGVDSFAGQLAGRPCIWQCKHFVSGIGKSQREQIKKSLRTALKNFRPKSWVLCLPVDLDIRVHRWFDRLRESYKDRVAIGLFQGSDIEAHLVCNRPLLNAFFPGAIVDNQELKALALRVGELSLEQMAALSAENAEEYLQRLQDIDPRLAFRVTFPPVHPYMQESLPDRDVPEGLLLSVSDDRKTIDVFARDFEALNIDPPTFTVKFTGKSISKLRDAIRTGSEASFDSDEVMGVTSSLKFLLPQEFKPSKLILGPSLDIKKRRFSFRVSFSLGSESEVYDFVEFKYLRAGTEEVELVGRDPSSCLEMSFTIKSIKPVHWRLRPTWKGKDVSSALKAVHAVNLLMGGGSVEIYDLKKSARLFTVQAHAQQDRKLYDEFEIFLRNLATISEVFSVPLNLPEDVQEDDERALGLLLAIVHRGRVTFPRSAVRDATFNLQKHEQFVEVFQTLARDGGPIRVDNVPFPLKLNLFGQAIDPGPCMLLSPKTELLDAERSLQQYLAAADGEFVRIKIKPLDRVDFVFSRLAPATP